MRLFVDNLTNVDFSYLCPQRGLVGETWLAHIELLGDLDKQGMVCDFGIVKKVLRNWLDEQLDHRLLVPKGHPQIHCIENDSETEIQLTLDSGERIITSAPAQAVTLINTDTISADNVAQWCIRQLHGVFAQSVQQIRLRFTHEDINGPYYHYSHGLKKHQGNCQRIAHGHRSKLLVWRNNELCQQSMQSWSERWRDIYIATKEDCIALNEEMASFAYQSEQGAFSLTLPSKRCYFVETDTTVEHIAQHLANEIGKQFPNDLIEVKAFEGISKGAITSSAT